MHTDGSLRYRLKGFELLEKLALNLRWSWNHSADWIWQQLDAALWEETRNPWIVLKSVSIEKLTSLLSEAHFKAKVRELVHLNHVETTCSAWFHRHFSDSPLTAVAYFSMEYMLTEALPIYSGGLGNVAGDQLKAASDLGVPVSAIGLLYQQGYFRQSIDKDGAQQALYPYNDPGQLPITPLRKSNGEWLRLRIEFPGCCLWLRTWQVRVGRVNLYLLDSNDMANLPIHRGITSELYGGSPELRLKQEILLGIGGWRLLEALGIEPEVCHLNEGHAAFAILERARSYMLKNSTSFEVALTATRAGNVFTTHTAVPAGFDRFSAELLKSHFEHYITHIIGIPFERFLALGKANPSDVNEPFNMAYLAVRGSGAINGVSQLHAKVSQALFAPLFPRWPQREVPIGYVTNGIHVPSWIGPAADNVWAKACGAEPWLDCTETLEHKMQILSEETLWQMRQKARKQLVENVHRRLARQMTLAGASDIENTANKFNADVLTLGFARRFATYKRPNLLLINKERLLKILNHPTRPVQLILAGKAHPADFAGKTLIQEWNHFIGHSGSRVVFLDDYDMLLTEELVQGVDVWINTPRRPWEACGTSGMKILANGGLNVSELDGWWAEAYTPEVGWALGSCDSLVNLSDVEEANALYDLLEQQIIPEFYTRNAQDISSLWVCRMRESMARLTGHFSSNRALRQYVEEYYVPAAKNYQARSQNASALAKQGACQQVNMHAAWNALRFGCIQVTQVAGVYEFEVPLYLNGVDQKLIAVQLYAEGIEKPLAMQPVKTVQGSTIYSVSIPATRPAADYTPRIIPGNLPLSLPLECADILWAQ